MRIHVGTARKPPKQRAWRKLHIAVDRKTGNIVASELTASRARDATRVPALLTQIQPPLASASAASAYDKEAVYEAIEAIAFSFCRPTIERPFTWNGTTAPPSIGVVARLKANC
ncbi:MAG: transposase [Gammaproteobacteria bacterium]|nr:transposase [Gammaproteobacteria bacterium]